MNDARRLSALLVIGALLLVVAWTASGDASLRGTAHDHASVLRALVVDRSLDLFAGTGPLSPDGHGPAAREPWLPAALPWLPAFSVAHLASYAGSRFAPEGVNPFYGSLIALSGLALVVLGLARLARAAVSRGVPAGTAAACAALLVIGTPLGALVLRGPGHAELVVFALGALLLDAGETPRAVLGATIAVVDPFAAGWLALALARPAWVLAALAVLSAPQLLAWHGHGGVASGLAALGADLHPGALSGHARALAAHPLALLALAGVVLRRRPLELVVIALTGVATAGRPATSALVLLAPLAYGGLVELATRAHRAGLPRSACAAALALAAVSAPLPAVRLPAQLVMTEAELSPLWLLGLGAGHALSALALSSREPAAGVVLLVAGGLALGGVVLVAPIAGAPSRACVWSAGPAFVDAGRPTRTWHPPAGTRARTLELVTAMDPSGQIAPGAVVALVTVRDAQGREHDYPIAWGVDTYSEWTGDPARSVAPPNDGPQPGMHLLKLHAARHATTGLALRQLSIGQSYRTRCDLPLSAEIEEIRVETRHKACRLEIHGAWLGL